MSSGKRVRFSWREMALLMLPILLIAGWGLVLSRQPNRQQISTAFESNYPIQQAYWLPDGDIVAYERMPPILGKAQGQFSRRNVDTGKVEQQVPFPAGVYQFSVSPDGHTFQCDSYVGQKRGFALYNAALAGKPKAQFLPQAGLPVWNKNRIYFLGPKLSVYDAGQGALDNIEAARVKAFMPFVGPKGPLNIDFSPDGNSALVSAYPRHFNAGGGPPAFVHDYQTNMRMTLLDWRNGKVLFRFPGDGWLDANFVNAGKELLGANFTNAGVQTVHVEIARFNLTNKKVSWINLDVPEGRLGLTGGGRFSPDGRFLLAHDQGGNYHLYSTQTGKQLDLFKNASGNFNANWKPQFSPDGRYFLALRDKKIELVDLHSYLPKPQTGAAS